LSSQKTFGTETLGTEAFFFKACVSLLTEALIRSILSPSVADQDDDLKFLATATDDLQESLIAGRLAEAGIHCMSSHQLIRAGVGARCDVYVRATDLERARAVLKEDEGGFDEAELARLSEEAGKENPAEP
jgi:hypothetical protein